MKIAVYYNLKYGGAKRTVQEHVKVLKKLHNTVDVYTQDSDADSLSPGLFADKTYYYPFKLIDIKIPIISRIYKDLQVFFSLKKLHKKIARDIDRRRYDIALVHTDAYTQSPFLLRYLKTKNVYHCMEPLRIAYEYTLRIPSSWGIFNRIYEFINRYLRKIIDRTNARSAMHTLAISYFCRSYMIQVYDIHPGVSYLGVDEKIFRPLKLKKKNQVLFIASKEYLVGYDLAKAALKLIPEEKRPELKIVFGPIKSKRISDEELVKVYNESLVTLSLSRMDTFGMVPLESMACETPVIATSTSAYREIVVDGKTGYLVEFDPKEIAEKILELQNSPTLASQMGKEGRRIVEKKWTWEKIIKQLETVLMKISNNKL